MTMKKKVLVYLHNAYADWELGFVLPELKKADWEIRTVAAEGRNVTSMGGLRVEADEDFSSLSLQEPFDLVLLPGGDSWNDPSKHQALLAALPAWHEQGRWIAAICGAVTALARSGLLDSVRHTSNFLPLTQHLAPQYRGASLHTGHLAERDARLITASGNGALEFTAEILKGFNVFDEAQAEEWLNFYKKGIPFRWMLNAPPF